MNKYKVSFTKTIIGTTDVFADNEDHAVNLLNTRPPLDGYLDIITEDYDFTDVELLPVNKESSTDM